MDWMHLGTWLDEVADVALPALESKQPDTWGRRSGPSQLGRPHPNSEAR